MKNGRIAFQILVSIALVLSLVLPASIAATPANAASGLHGQQAAYGPEWSSPGVHDAPYSGGVGEDGVSSASGLAELSTESTEIAQIVGDTREVNCNILPRVFVVLYQDGVFVRAAISDESGAYVMAVPSLGDYEVVASKGGFRDETRTISVEEAATHIVDFRGDYGLIPNAPDVHYYAACARLLGRQAGPCRLDVSKVAAVRDAWKHPVSQETDHDPRNRLQQELQLTDEQLEQLETGTGTLQLTEEQVNILSDHVTQLLEDLESWLDEEQWHEVKEALESMLAQGQIDLEALGPVAEAIHHSLISEAEANFGVYTGLMKISAESTTTIREQSQPEGPQFSNVVTLYTPKDSSQGDKDFEQPGVVLEFTRGLSGESIGAVDPCSGTVGVYSDAGLMGAADTYALQRVLINVPADGTDITITSRLLYTSGTSTVFPPPSGGGGTDIVAVHPYRYTRSQLSYLVIDSIWTWEDAVYLALAVVSMGATFPVQCMIHAATVLQALADARAYRTALEEDCTEETVTYSFDSLTAGDYIFEVGFYARARTTLGIASAFVFGMIPEIEVTLDIPSYTLDVASTAGGQVMQPGEGTHTYWAGQEVNLVAEADDWYVFSGWTGDTESIADSNSASTTITVNANYAITAEFEALDPNALFAGGSGTVGDPYKIANWYHLHNIKYGPWAHYILIGNLGSATAGYTELAGPAANDGQGWLPIGNEDEPFTGTFNGQGQEIRDLFVYRPHDSHVGLFGYAGSGAGLKNTGVVNVDVTGYRYVGGLVGQSRGYVDNCYSSGTVSGQTNVGGLVGRSHNTISGSHATGSVSGNQRVGGLAGDNYLFGTVSSSYFSGAVEGDEYVGGLVGQNDGEIITSHATGDVTAQFRIGGLVGYNTGTVTSSYSGGSIAGESLVGGLVGENTGSKSTVSNSYSTGSVAGDVRIGGLIGYNHWGTVSDTYATGSVTGSNQVGGLIACNAWGKVGKSYSTGSVIGSQQVGGLVGWNYDGTVSSSFWDVETSGIDVSDGGIGKTTAEMHDIATFLDATWEITAVDPDQTNPAYIWNVVDGQAYPFLSWQADEEEEPDEFTLTITSTEGGSVTEPGEGTFTRDAGTVVSLVAAPATGYQFVNWTGDVGTVANVNAASTTVTMNGNYSIKANFEEIPTVQYDLTISSTAGGSVTTPGEGIYTYDAGIVVNLVAEAEEGYRFVNWTGDVGTVGNVDTAATTITMNDNYSITANFEANEPPWLLITVHPWDYATPIEDIVDQGGSWHNSDFTRHIYAYDPDGTVVSYEYFVYDNIGHTVISSGTGDVSWDGSYYWVASQTFTVGEDGDFSVQGKNASTLYVRVEDNEGAVSEWATVTYNIDWTPPSVGIVSPTTATAGVPEVFSATVSDNVELNYAFLYVDGSYVGSMTLDPSPVPGGESGTASMEYAFALPGTYTMYVRCADHYDPESETYLNLASGSPVAVEVSEATDPEVTFPDANLEAAIREAIGKPTGDIYPSDLEKLTYLDASDRNITELTGLEYCSDLTVLCLFHNQISDISPLAGLTSLTDLHLWANQISNISPLAGLTSLTRLYLGSNQISDISPVAGLTSLTYLDLGGNQISDVSPLAGLTSLTNLYLWNNQVSDISPLTGLTSLTGLDLKWNQISDISPLAGLTSLTDLHLWANQISDISPLAGLTSLTYLDLGINQISDISPLAGLTSLPHLELGRNQISDISPLAGLTSLTNLRLYENQISDISPLAGLTSLTRLRLWDNQISDISPLAGLTGLTWLSLGGNQISDISPLAGLTSLLLLSLGSNQISDISPLAGLTSLTYLYLYSNQISDIAPLVDNTGLGEGDEVDLQDNPLSDDSINIYIPELEARGVKVQY